MARAEGCLKWIQEKLEGKETEGRVYKHFFKGFLFLKERNEMVAKKGSAIKKFCLVEVRAACLNADETYPVERMRKRMAGVRMGEGDGTYYTH